ncbi:hypothetical protein AVENLUH5627_00596 [Acinetobacter venetianus]|uniref:RiboL-PSP-HEPN domain-containing protein n=1 Tax=Acinetobacter venetianus TaxID=52133 RepID=A0A150I1D1_9GAMM|nr:MAE_28990/MAE_18760 family HEPN-like nuclease [Acinetobacter venetianus]KXZ73440.1 hypothetical protein AVENLUH5627_00596 [Acinetobacter venetianus]
MNVKTTSLLIDYIENEKGWRTKELLNFRSRSLSIKGVDQTSMFKLGICLVYSHWEGFVKNSGAAFFTFLVKNGFKYKDLQDRYKVCAFLDHFDGQYPHKNFKSNLVIVKNQIDFNKSISIDPTRFIDTKSNLTYEILEEILEKIGLNNTNFVLKKNFIDESLVRLRNAISHGEYRTISQKEFLDVYDETMVLIENFFTEIVNFIVQNGYKN